MRAHVRGDRPPSGATWPGASGRPRHARLPVRPSVASRGQCQWRYQPSRAAERDGDPAHPPGAGGRDVPRRSGSDGPPSVGRRRACRCQARWPERGTAVRGRSIVKVVPLAADSLGVRSMATWVECGSTGLLLDPGATLAPSRYGLPPAEEEWEALRRANDRISAYASRAAVVFVSHYHEDHFRTDPTVYADRFVLAKDPRRMVAGQQARRALALWSAVRPLARLQSADGWQRREPDMVLRVSPPLPHGPEGTALGSVVALTVEDPRERERFVFGSDVQGPLSPVAAAYLIRERPSLLYLSGPPSYIEGEVGRDVIERGIDHLLRVIAETGCRVIMDHYALRDARAPERFARLWETGRVMTAAAYAGVDDLTLEARRAQLWGGVRKPPARAGRRETTRRGGRLGDRAGESGDASAGPLRATMRRTSGKGGRRA